MAKVIIESCDVCGTVKKPDAHWSTWGENVVVGFKQHPSVQSDIKFDLICSGCVGRIKDSIFKTMNEISLESCKKNSDMSGGV